MQFIQHQHIIEEQFLSPYAAKSINATRQRPLATDELRTDFIRDRDRILHSKAFRRLKHKTQVFLSPEGDHYRTRLTHTLEVAAIARTISRALKLNEDLTEAIALGHDLGHTPYGHAGERALNVFTPFFHAEQGLRVVDFLENEGEGINLTLEVRDGILNHTSKGKPKTLEGEVVSWADRIAYINHDIDDSLRGGIIKLSDIPTQFIKVFGIKHGQRINCMVLDIIKSSVNQKHVRPSEEFMQKITGLRQFMFDNVYLSSEAKLEEQKAVGVLSYLYEYYIKHTDKLPKYIQKLDATAPQKVCDYISMMTDRFAASLFERLTIPKGWAKL